MLFVGGFEGSYKLVDNLFEMCEDGFLLFNENDEFMIVLGIYFCGFFVRYDNYVFCFIFKFW